MEMAHASWSGRVAAVKESVESESRDLARRVDALAESNSQAFAELARLVASLAAGSGDAADVQRQQRLHAARVPRVPAYIGHEVRGSRVIMAQELVQHSEPVGRWVENAPGAVFFYPGGDRKSVGYRSPNFGRSVLSRIDAEFCIR